MVEQRRKRWPWEAIGAVAGVGALAWGVITFALPEDSPQSGAGAGPTTVTPPPVTVTAPNLQPEAAIPGGGSSAGGVGGVGGVTAGDPGPVPQPDPPVVIAAAQPAISTVGVVPRIGNGILTKVGPNVFELPSYPSSINPPLITFDWMAQGPGGKISSDDCAVSIQIDGPGPHFPQADRSSECSGSPNTRPEVYDPGNYTVTVTVTPPGGGGPVTGTATFTLVPQGG